jgi:hypothetical protein
MLYQVTSDTRSAPRHLNAPVKRILAFVLLALVAYAATAEVVHRHGRSFLATSGSTFASIARSGDGSSALNDSLKFSECSICQLRQQLSFSLLNAAPQIIAPQTELTHARAASRPAFSHRGSPQRGRAPPQTSLI